MCEHLHYKKSYTRSKNTIYRAGAAVVSTTTSGIKSQTLARLCPIHFTLSDTKGDWRPIRPPNRVSRVLGLVSGQIDSPYLFIMSLITIPRDEYHTAHGSCRLPRQGRYTFIGIAQLLLRSRLSKREHC